MANFSFSQQGATPTLPAWKAPALPAPQFGSTPAAKALGAAATPNMSTPSGPRYAPPPSMATPSTPVKKQTVQNVDGSVHTTEYHAPTTPGLLGASKATPEPTAASGTFLPGSAENSGSLAASGAENMTTTPASAAPTYPGLIKGITDTATGANQNPNVTKGLDQYGKIAQNIADIRGTGEAAKAGYLTGGLTLPVSQGRAQVLGQTEAAQEQALGAQEQAALQSANTAISGQSATQTGLNDAASLAKPESGASFFGSPVTGDIVGGSGGGLDLNYWSDFLANGGDPSQVPSTILSAPNLKAQLIQATQQKNPKFDINTSLGNASARESNAQVGGTAPVTANQAIYSKALDTYYTLNNAIQNVDQFGQLLTSGMTDKQGQAINPSNVKYANQTLQQIRGALSSDQQAVYDTTLAALRSKVSGLLSAGGTEIPTAVTADAQKIIDGTLPLSSLDSVLKRISQEGTILLQNQGSIVNQARSGTLGGSSQSASSNGGGSNTSAGGFNFKQVNGQWVPA